MMVMMMRVRNGGVYVTVSLATVLALTLKLERRVHYSVLGELLAHGVLDCLRLAACYYVHSGVVALTVHTPYVHVVNAQHSVDLADVLR